MAAVGRASRKALVSTVREEIRAGALCAASPEEIGALFDVWRRTLGSFAASVGGTAHSRRLLAALDGLEPIALGEARIWEKERIDIVVMGASAGGIPALRTILGALGKDMPATILIVQHTSAKAPSLMPRVLGRSCRLPVVHAVDGAEIFLGVVHVAPPGRHLSISGGRIHLLDAPPVRYAKPAADVLFASAAKAFGPHVTSIVLSGADSDGTAGTVAVRDAGGVTIVQHPGSAQFPSMPASAIATGAVEYVVTLPLLGGVVERLVRDGRSALRESVGQVRDGE